MRVFSIETSCDETSAAVVVDGMHVLSNVIATVADFSTRGGVIPELAARRQLELILAVIHKALDEADVTSADIDAVAVTMGPGLLTSLLVGTTAARTLAALWRKPLIGVHHTLGHLSSVWLLPPGDSPRRGQELSNPDAHPKVPDPIPVPTFPCLTLSASGGHTDLWYRTSHTKGILLGATRDDAAGEAFDKGAALLGLPFPGGPAIAKLAEGGRVDAFPFPLPLRGDDSLSFSFSGLKTALKYLLEETGNRKQETGDVAASYQEAICRHLCDRVTRALKLHPDAREVHLVGGVSANTRLRQMLSHVIAPRVLRTPVSLRFCTDNAAMIAAAAEFMVRECGEAAYAPFQTQASMSLECVVHRT